MIKLGRLSVVVVLAGLLACANGVKTGANNPAPTTSGSSGQPAPFPSPAPTPGPPVPQPPVQPPVAPPPIPVPPPPVPVTHLFVFSDLQTKAWSTCGNCGNTGASGATATYEMVPGSPAMFTISGPPFTNAFWWLYLPNGVGFHTFTYDFDLQVREDIRPQAIEFGIEERLNNSVYNMDVQDDYADGKWRIWDASSHSWVATAFSATHFSIGTHHITVVGHAVSGTVFHDYMVLDGTKMVFDTPFPANPHSGSNFLRNAFQLDLDANGNSYQVFLDNVTVTVD